MARPGRIALGVVLLSGALFAGAAPGATPGVTAAEQERAVEFYKRIADKASRELAQDFAKVYRRRAYLLDVDPVEKLAKEFLNNTYRIEDRDRLRYFALSLDALVRGANLKDLQATVKMLQDGSYTNQQRAKFTEDFIGVAGRYSSPTALAMLAEEAYDSGVVGQRLSDFLSLAVSIAKRGEDPDHIKRIYDVARKIAPSVAFQRDFLEKCFRAVRLGAPPLPLTEAVERMGNRFELDTRLDEALDRILRLYFAGQPFGAAVNAVVPPGAVKKEE